VKELAGLRVLLWGFSGAGFPGGDGAREAERELTGLGLPTVYTHAKDPDVGDKLAQRYDVAIVTNTRIGELLQADARLWSAADQTALWFWDLRPGHVGAPLRDSVDRVFLSYNGPWRSPAGDVYDPKQWAAALDCPVGYAPQASPCRDTVAIPDAPRVVFVGDVANKTYHRGRAELCRALDATVVNARQRADRLRVEASLPGLYSSSRYVLSTSPRAPGYTSVRTYSILACGGLMLLQRFPGCDRLFRDGEHVVTFNGAADLLPRLAELDEQPEKRARIAAAGRQLQRERHTVTHRVFSICSEMVGKTEGFSGWL
jgi:hypothetical protein